MNAVFLVEVESMPILSFLGYLLVLTLPIFLLLLIARFRGFFASIFFLPFSLSTIYFISSFSLVTDQILKTGLFGSGVIKGIETYNNLFSSIHFGIFSQLADKISLDFIKTIFNSNWFGFALYLVLFVIFFLLFKKKKRKKDEDLF